MLTCLFGRHFVLVIVEILSAVQEAELGVVFLFCLGHLLEFRAISCDKLCELVYYISQILIYKNKYVKQTCIVCNRIK